MIRETGRRVGPKVPADGTQGLRMLDSVITAMAGQGRPWFATHAQIADLAARPGGSPGDAP